MSSSMTSARESRQSVQFFDVDIFRNKLEKYMRNQVTEMCEVTNNKKRKLEDRWSNDDKEEMEFDAESRDDLVYQFNKRQRSGSYYPIDDDEMPGEEISPLALPSPVSAHGDEASQPWPFFDMSSPAMQLEEEDDSDPMSMAMRRKLSGYSEVSSLTATYDDDWMAACPPLSRASLSSTASNSDSMPHTPNNGVNNEHFMDDLNRCNGSLLASSDADLDLDLNSMAPHERTLLAALAPEKFEKAALIRKAFRQSDKVLNQLALAREETEDKSMHMDMDDGEYDQVFGELMHV